MDGIKIPKDGFTYGDNPYNAPIRRWIVDYMSREFPAEKEYRSDSIIDSESQKYETWTQTTQDPDRAEKYGYFYLFKLWAGKGGFSTCSSFVAILVTRIRQNGGLYPKSGLPPRFEAFNLSLNKKGWIPYPNAEGKTPNVGDIFAVGSPTNMKHVGVIMNTDGHVWQTVEAGGGQIGKYQSIKRTGWHTPPAGLCGWIDIEEYFDNWKNPKYP